MAKKTKKTCRNDNVHVAGDVACEECTGDEHGLWNAIGAEHGLAHAKSLVMARAGAAFARGEDDVAREIEVERKEMNDCADNYRRKMGYIK